MFKTRKEIVFISFHHFVRINSLEKSWRTLEYDWIRAFEPNFANFTINEAFFAELLAQQPLSDKKCTTTINASLDGRQVDPQNLSILSACQSESSAAKRRKKTLQFSQKALFRSKSLVGHHWWRTITVNWKTSKEQKLGEGANKKNDRLGDDGTGVKKCP